MRLYRGLKTPYRPERVDPTRRSGGTDFTDWPAITLLYAQGSRGVVLVVDIDPDELRNARDDAKAPLLRAFIARELHDRRLRSQLAPRSDVAGRVTPHEQRWVIPHER